MQMVKRLGREGKYYYGLFLCPECGRSIRMQMNNGPKSTRCFDCYQRMKIGQGNPNYRHGDSSDGQRSKLYWVWADIKSRTTNPHHHAAKRYVLRGIAICDEWLKFEKFKEWAMESGYKAGLTIDRIDNDGSYCPSNCRWVTNIENCQNSSRAKIDIKTAKDIKELLANGAKLVEAASLLGCSLHIVREISRGRAWRNA